MPHIWEVLTPPEIWQNFPRETQKNFYKSRGIFTFGSFNNPYKINAKTLDLWCAVLKKSPENTQFHWYRGDFKDKSLKQKFINEFQKRHINIEKIIIEPTFSADAYLQKLQSVDLILDTIPITGMTTTAEGLSLGIPTLTLLGNLMSSRLSGSCINAIGDANLNKNFIFDNENDFINQAVFFANNLQKLNELKINLAEKARKSPLCDAELFAKNFEIQMWNVWKDFVNS